MQAITQEFVTVEEISRVATRLQSNDFLSREQMINLLHGLFNGGLDLMRMFSVTPNVTVKYKTVTDGRRRIGGRDYKRSPGISMETHYGPLTTAWRAKNGGLLILISDAARQGWTACRLEGLVEITPGLPGTQRDLTGPLPVKS